MRRSRKNDDLFLVRPVAVVAIGLMALGILNRNFRIALVGTITMVFLLAVVLIIGFAAYKIATGKAKGGSAERTLPRHGDAGHAATRRTARPSDPKPFMLPSYFVPYSKPESAPIDRLREIDWYQFERFVAYVYEKRGFNVSRKGGANPDGGVDMVIEKEGHASAVQCKQWKTWKVGVKAIREFLGALADSKTQRGIFITLNGYTGDAKQLAEKHGIEMINENGLRRMVEGLDLREPRLMEIFDDTRKICPKCERRLVARTARHGGNKFWGCSGFPQGCRFTMPI